MICVGFTVLFTFIRFPHNVSSLMYSKETEITECFTTFFAFIGFFSYVSPFVFEKFDIPIDISILFTLIEFLSNVGYFIYLM